MLRILLVYKLLDHCVNTKHTGGVNRLREVFTQAVDAKALEVAEQKLAGVKEEIAAWERKEMTLSNQKLEELEEVVAEVEKLVASLV